jgi:hypothetical protein
MKKRKLVTFEAIKSPLQKWVELHNNLFHIYSK